MNRRETLDALVDKTWKDLLRVYNEYLTVIGPHDDWFLGAVYVRESADKSMEAESPADQLHRALALLAAKSILVPWDLVAFETGTATEVEPRKEFLRLLEVARQRHVRVILGGTSSRLFRDEIGARQTTDALRMDGIELRWVDKPKLDPRSTHAWMLEGMAFHQDELWARQTSESVGKTFETLSARGRGLSVLCQRDTPSPSGVRRLPAFTGPRSVTAGRTPWPGSSDRG